MSVMEQIDVSAIVPDSIEPVEALRCWSIVNGELRSLNSGGGVTTVWKPGEALTAKCNSTYGARYKWNVVRRGLSAEDAADHATRFNNSQSLWTSFSRRTHYGGFGFTHYGGSFEMPQPPRIVLPDGYGFELETITHEAPHEHCSCGIYATTKKSNVPQGDVCGKVKLWGKVVPGEHGYRAQFAYPSEFHVSAEFAGHPVLEAFGVPIVVAPAVSRVAANTSRVVTGRVTATRVAIALNLGACAANLVALGMRSWFVLLVCGVGLALPTYRRRP